MIGGWRHTLFKIAAIVLVVALIVAFFVIHRQREAEQNVQRQQAAWECEQALAPLRQQRDELLNQIEDLNTRLRGGDLFLGSVMMLFVQPNDDILTDTLPTLQKEEYPCIVCCEPGSFPGDKNCISVEQARELVDLGWEFGLSLVPEDDVAALCEEMTDLGLPSPTVAYYPLANFNADDPEQEQNLLAQGITTVLQYNFVPEDNDAHQLQYIAAYGFRERNCKSVLAGTVANSNALAFTIGYNNAYERYEKRPFLSMTSLFFEYAEENHLMVTTTDVALARRAQFNAVVDERKEPLTAERDECARELAEIEDEITRVYDEYISNDS
ncbi:MAG: hypothetical protein IKI63_04575 [Clostridia bacterium]|nr:hypothetical protein [Clostridia bacterium]